MISTKKIFSASVFLFLFFILGTQSLFAEDAIDQLRSDLKSQNLPDLSGVVSSQYTKEVRSQIQSDMQSESTSSTSTTLPYSGPYRITSNPSVQNQASITVSSSNTLLATGNDYRVTGNDTQCGVYASSDGISWLTSKVILPVAGRFGSAGDSSIAMGASNIAHLSCLAFNRSTGQSGIYAYRISNVGTPASLSYSNPIQVITSYSSNVFHDKPYIAADPKTNKVLISWTQFANNKSPIIISQSVNNGSTFNSPGFKQITDTANWSNQGSVPFYGAGGIAYVAWLNYNTGTIMIDRSTNGSTWGVDKVMSSAYILPTLQNTTFRVNSYPSAAADPSNGNHIYAVWADYRNNKSDIMFVDCTYATATNMSCNPAKIISGATSTDQFMPWMSVNANGVISVFYYSRVDTTTSKMVAYVATSFDKGVTFNRTAVSSVIDQADGWKDYIGDYSGITSTTTKAYPAYTGALVENGSTNQDIYTSLFTLNP